MRVAIDQRLNLEAIRRISDAKLIQLVDEAARKGGLKATPKDDDTFLNDEKGCLFLLNACFLVTWQYSHIHSTITRTHNYFKIKLTISG